MVRRGRRKGIHKGKKIITITIDNDLFEKLDYMADNGKRSSFIEFCIKQQIKQKD